MKAANFETLSDIFSFFTLIVAVSFLAFFLLFMKQAKPITIKSSPFGNNSVKIEYIETLAALEGGSPAKSEIVEKVKAAPKIEAKPAPIQKTAPKPVPQKVQSKALPQKTQASATKSQAVNLPKSKALSTNANGNGKGQAFGQGRAFGNGSGNKQVGASGTLNSQNLSQNRAFIDNFLNAIQASLQYPANARKANIQGIVNVKVVFDKSGKILSASLADNKQPAILGKAALATIAKVKAKWTANLKLESQQSIIIPIVFKLK